MLFCNIIKHQTFHSLFICFSKIFISFTKYQLLFNKRESTGLKHFNDFKHFTEYSNDMGDIYKNIEEYNSGKERKILILFDDMISGMLSNKKLNPTVTQ